MAAVKREDPEKAHVEEDDEEESLIEEV